MTDEEAIRPIDNNQRTIMIAQEMGLLPTTKVYRWQHPLMVCGIEDGRLLVKGNKENNTLVLDEYGSDEIKKRASNLINPGINFTLQYSDNYRSDIRRTAISLSMDEQPEGLQIYPDAGSEVRSAYYTLPKDAFFRVGAEHMDPLELAIALKVRSTMDKLGLVEEPAYLNWLEAGKNGVRVVTYFPNPQGKDQKIEVTFIRENDDSYRVDVPNLEDLDEMRENTEDMAIYRFLLENRNFNTLMNSKGAIHVKNDLVEEITKSSEFVQLEGLRKSKI